MDPNLIAAINDSLDAFVKLLWPLATVLAGVSVASMAVLQVIKDLLPVRRWFQEWWIEAWFRDRAEKTNRDSVKAIQDLLSLVTGGERRAFYDLRSPCTRF